MATQIKSIVPKKYAFYIVGTAPMIQHAWSEKALRQLRMTAAERRKQEKVARNPEGEALAAMYRTADGQPGLPMLAFKAALIGAAHKDLGIEKTLVRKALFLPASEYSPGLIALLETSGFEIREDIVRVGNQQTDLRYRPQFNEWRVRVVVEVDADLLTMEDVVKLVDRAGFSVGIGEWRPEKGGEYGRFQFDASEPVQEI
jgi:hypothetical protein